MPKKSPYSQTPSVPAKKMAGTNPMGIILVGSGSPGMIPKQMGPQPRGLTPKNEFSQPHPHGFGQKLKHRKGNHRLSGSSKSHKLGG